MNAAEHYLDFSVIAPDAILNAIVRLLSRRRGPMSERQLQRWFCATPATTLSSALATLLATGRIRCVWSSLNRARRVLLYGMI